MTIRTRVLAWYCLLCLIGLTFWKLARPSESSHWRPGPQASPRLGSEDAPFVSRDVCNTTLRREESVIPEWDISRVVRGSPTVSFRDNLKDDIFYLTSWSNAGFTNQFMSYVNMIYLGVLSGRVPIVPPFAPDHHISPEAGALPFGRIFNMSRLRENIRIPVLEWSDVKLLPSETAVDIPPEHDVEPIGCWSTRHVSDPNPLTHERVAHNLHLDVAYTRAPDEARWNPQDPNDDFVILGELVRYIDPEVSSQAAQGRPLMKPGRYGHTLSPDTHISCFDFLYFATTSRQQYEWEYSWSPAWRFVGKYMYFTDELVAIGREYLTRVFEIDTEAEIPPFIAVHIRHGDFASPSCQVNSPDCYTPLTAFTAKVKELKKELTLKRGIEVTEVLAFSDDNSPEFWTKIEDLGWRWINHTAEMTFETYGEWYPPIIEVVIQSMSKGFIGTQSSTFSLVSSRRVQDWNHGLGWMI